MLSIIVAKARNNVIGSHNDLPWYLPADLKHFKQLTTDHTVIMGRKTFESIVTRLGKPLPDRRSVVLTRDTGFLYTGVEVIHSVDSIRRFDNAWIIGGAELYRQTIDLADQLYITDVHADIPGDTYFPLLGTEWRETSRETHQADGANPFDYDFVVYERQET